MLFVSVVNIKSKVPGRNGLIAASMGEKEIADYKRLVREIIIK